MTAHSLYQSGMEAYKAGRADEAVALIRRAIAVDAHRPDYFCDVGIALAGLGRLDEATAAFRQALALDPAHAGAHNNLGIVLRRAGQLQEAIEAFRRALAVNPDSAETWNNLGTALRDTGKLDEAIDAYRQALRLKQNYPNALNNLGNALRDGSRLDEAIHAYRQALAERSDFVEAHNNLGMALHAKGDLDAAMVCYRHALTIQPRFDKAMSNLGVALQAKGLLDEAIAAFAQAIALRPDSVEAHNNLGVALHTKGQFDQAIAVFERALPLRPDHPEIHLNLGIALLASGRMDRAIDCLEKLCASHPENIEAHWNLSLALLRTGDYARGWKEFEWRLRMPQFGLSRVFAQPQWMGQDIRGKTVLLFTEGGFGDALHFIRYAPAVAERGARVLLECQPQLIALFERVPGISAIIPRGQPLPEFDWQVPLQSLPAAFGTTLATVPGAVPYLSAPPERVSTWKQRLSSDASFKVGLVWAGSGKLFRSNRVDVFAALADVRGITFYSLQKGPQSGQKPPAGMNWVDFTDELNDFADTAGLIQQLDLVISVDTSVAHLAGALAKPVWVLMPIMADFRWLVGRSDSPWYPTMRVFYQTTAGDWQAPVEQMRMALQTLVESRS